MEENILDVASVLQNDITKTELIESYVDTLEIKGENNINRKPKLHKLKTIQPYYQEIKERKKNFELRLNDRDYQIGDTVLLEEWTGKCYTGDGVTRKIKYILKDCSEFGLMNGYCIFGW